MIHQCTAGCWSYVLGYLHENARLTHTSVVMNTAQTGEKLSREVLEAVFAEEKFPDIIVNNPKSRTVFTLLENALGMLWWVVVGP